MTTVAAIEPAYSPRTLVDLQHQLMGGFELPDASESREALHWELAERHRRQRNVFMLPGIAIVAVAAVTAFGAESTTTLGFAAIAGISVLALLKVLDNGTRREAEQALTYSTLASDLPSDLADLRWLPVSTLRWRWWRRRMVADIESDRNIGRYMIATEFRPVPLASQAARRRQVIVRSSGPLATVTRLLPRRRAADRVEQPAA